MKIWVGWRGSRQKISGEKKILAVVLTAVLIFVFTSVSRAETKPSVLSSGPAESVKTPVKSETKSPAKSSAKQTTKQSAKQELKYPDPTAIPDDSKDHPVKKTMEEQTGEVTGVTPMNISVMYATEGAQEFETLFSLNSKVKLVGYKKVMDIQKGDVVRMSFEKAVEFPGKPGQRTTLTLKSVNFVKRGPKPELGT